MLQFDQLESVVGKFSYADWFMLDGEAYTCTHYTVWLLYPVEMLSQWEFETITPLVG